MKVISSTMEEFLFHDLVAKLMRWSEACWICFAS